MSRATLFFAAFALSVSIGCARLGLWQISRLRERQTRNALVFRRLDAPPVPLASLIGDTAVRFRRATAAGRYDFAHELIYATRPRNGSPGVNVLTPLLVGAGDSAILVNRGWVYSPNAMTLTLPQWRESDSARVEGFIEEYVPSDGPVGTPSERRAVRRLDLDSIQARIPYPLLPLLLVEQTQPPAPTAARVPVRIEPPALSEGSHRSYAIQWFGFSITGIVGTVLVVARDRRRANPRAPGHEGGGLG